MSIKLSEASIESVFPALIRDVVESISKQKTVAQSL